MHAGAEARDVDVPYSKMKSEIARILKDEGYIADYELDTTAAHPRIKITNKFVNRDQRHHRLQARQPARPAPLCGADEIPRVLGGMGIAILSTSRGVMTGREAKSKSRRRIARLCLVSEENAMSRIGKKPIELPDKVKVNIAADGAVVVEGPKGKLEWTLPKGDQRAHGRRTRARAFRERRRRAASRALHGLSRARRQHGHRRQRQASSSDLEIQGVGFKAAVQGKQPQPEPRIFARRPFPDSRRRSR